MSAVARPDYVVSGLLAAGVHLLLLVFLMAGLSWNHKPPEPVVVELWRDPVVLPSKPVAIAPPPRPAEPPPTPEPKPAPVPLPESKPLPVAPPRPPPPRAEPRPAPDAKAADIALQDKREHDRKQREEKAAEAVQAREAERQRLEEQQRADAQRREQEKRNREAMDLQVKAAEQQRQVRELAEAERRAAVQAAQQAQKQVDEFTARIRTAIRDKVILPPGIEGNPQAEFDVKLLKNGTVAAVRLVRSSGVAAYDRAVERAIEQAQPLPTPEDMEIFQQLRDLKLLFRPRD
jgi:colicin import membrane protein